MFVTVKVRAWLLAGVVFLVAIGYMPGVMSVSTTGRWAVITLIGLPVLLNWGIPNFCASLGSFLLCASLAWIVVGLFWSISFWDTLGADLHWLALVGLGLLATKVEDRRVIWLALALGVAVSLPYALLQAAGYAPVWTVARAGFPGNAGLFLTTNVLAEVATVACILMATQKQWVLAAFALLCAVLSGRSEVWLMLVTGGLVYWPRTRNCFGQIVVLVAIAFVILAAMGLIGDSMEQRLQIWASTIDATTFLGQGLGTYVVYFYPVYSFAHNELLQLIFELGVGAVFPIGLVAYAFFNGSIHNLSDKLALAALLASSTVWAPLQDPTTALLGSLLVGVLIGDRHRASWVATVQRGSYSRNLTQRGPIASREVRPADPGYGLLADGSQYPLGSGGVAEDV